MPRQLRLEYEGAIYHLMNRGDRREPIFHHNQDRHLFLKTLGEVCAKTDWQVHAFCLMNNHFHLVVETPKANLVVGMKWFLGTDTARFNRRHRLFGHLFSGRYKSLLVDGSGNGYLRSVCDYVHLNPVRAKLLKAEQPLEHYPWSSYGEYLKPPQKRFAWLRVDRLLGEMRIPKDSPAGRRQFAFQMEERRLSASRKEWKSLRRGWCLGDQTFRQELLAQAAERTGANHYGAERQQSTAEKAERMVRQELARLGWSSEDLKIRRKGDPKKVVLASRLRAQTTVSLRWIADRLQMGSWGYTANRIYAAQSKSQR